MDQGMCAEYFSGVGICTSCPQLLSCTVAIKAVSLTIITLFRYSATNLSQYLNM